MTHHPAYTTNRATGTINGSSSSQSNIAARAPIRMCTLVWRLMVCNELVWSIGRRERNPLFNGAIRMCFRLVHVNSSRGLAHCIPTRQFLRHCRHHRRIHRPHHHHRPLHRKLSFQRNTTHATQELVCGTYLMHATRCASYTVLHSVAAQRRVSSDGARHDPDYRNGALRILAMRPGACRALDVDVASVSDARLCSGA